jgi:hypothetical protein
MADIRHEAGHSARRRRVVRRDLDHDDAQPVRVALLPVDDALRLAVHHVATGAAGRSETLLRQVAGHGVDWRHDCPS